MSAAFRVAVDPFMKQYSFAEAFEVSCAFMERLQDIEIEDPYCLAETLTSDCSSLWDDILALASQEPDGKSLRKTICERLCFFVSDGPAGYDTGAYEEQRHIVTNFLERRFAGDAENARTLLDLADDMLGIGSGGVPNHGGEIASTSPGWERWAELRLAAMKAQGEPFTSRFAFAEEWPALRDELLAGMTDARRRRSHLAVEGLYDELMASIEGERANMGGADWLGNRFEETSRFRRELGTLYPERVAAIYREGIASYIACRGYSRRVYQMVGTLLSEMREVGSGKEAIELARWIHTEYGGRPALMEELRKMGR